MGAKARGRLALILSGGWVVVAGVAEEGDTDAPVSFESNVCVLVDWDPQLPPVAVPGAGEFDGSAANEHAFLLRDEDNRRVDFQVLAVEGLAVACVTGGLNTNAVYTWRIHGTKNAGAEEAVFEAAEWEIRTASSSRFSELAGTEDCSARVLDALDAARHCVAELPADTGDSAGR